MSIVEAVKAAGEDFEDVLYDFGIDVDEPLKTKRHGKRRWSEMQTAIYKHEDRHYALVTDEPSTENQEGMDRFVDFYEVVPQERVVTVVDYVRKTD